MNDNEPRILIFVLDRGFITVGKATISKDYALMWEVKSGVTIREWGTTKGLMELKHGPTPKTIIDEKGGELIPFRSIIKIITPTEKGIEKWEKHL